MKSSTLLVAIIIIAVIVVAGVAYYLTLPEPETEELKIAIVLPGSINDHGWSQSWFEGGKQVETELGIEVAYSEEVSVAEAGGVFTDYAERGYDVIFCCDFGQIDAAAAVGITHPEVIIGIPSKIEWVGVEPGDNIVSIAEDVLAIDDGYYAGILAAGLTNSGILGLIKPIPTPFIVATQEAFKLGALTYAQENAIPIKSVESILGTWEDIHTGYETTIAHIDAGADVILGGGDGINVGALMAASQRGGVYFIGASGDQRPIDPDICIASLKFGHYEVVKSISEMLMNGTLHDKTAEAAAAGTSYVVWEPYTLLIDFDELVAKGVVPAALRTRIEDAMAAYEAGTLDIPYLYEMTPPLDYTP